MDAIFSCKLYRTSNRKDKINSALNNPLNVELVQQLRDYLDVPEEDSTDYDRDLDLDVADELETDDGLENDDRSKSSSNESSRLDEVTPRGFHSPKSHSEDFDSNDVTDDKLENDADADNKDLEDSNEESEDADTDDSSANSSSVINASECCYSKLVDTESVKGTLNARDDTQGVSRIFVRDNELWIYYQDKINLNSVMEPVISVLNSTGFTNLEFNRLARAENAIVFEIHPILQPVESIEEINE